MLLAEVTDGVEEDQEPPAGIEGGCRIMGSPIS